MIQILLNCLLSHAMNLGTLSSKVFGHLLVLLLCQKEDVAALEADAGGLVLDDTR